MAEICRNDVATPSDAGGVNRRAFLLVLLAKDYWTDYPMATAPADAANGLATAQGEETPVLDRNAAAGAALALTRSSLQPVTLPVRVVQAEEATIPLGESDSVYVVKSGDTLSGIARSYATTIKAIKAANSLTYEHLTVGKRLRIPVSKTLIASNSQPILP